jgi:hypothetical protein
MNKINNKTKNVSKVKKIKAQASENKKFVISEAALSKFKHLL